MSKNEERKFSMEGFFLADIYKKEYNIYESYDFNAEENRIRSQLFLVAFDGKCIGENHSISFPKNPFHVLNFDEKKINLDQYIICSDVSATNKEENYVFLRRHGFTKPLEFLDANVINQIFTPTDGNSYEATMQLVVCKSILLLASIIVGEEMHNPMIKENEKAVRQYIKLFQEKPETIQRLFTYKDYDDYKFPGITQEICHIVQEETYKLEQKLKKK